MILLSLKLQICEVIYSYFNSIHACVLVAHTPTTDFEGEI